MRHTNFHHPDVSRTVGSMVEVVTPPSKEWIDLPGAKLHLKVEDDDDDDVIENLIIAVREKLEGELQRPLLLQTCRVHADAFPSERILLWHDVISVDAFQYTDATGAAQNVLPESYRLLERAYLVSRSWWVKGEDIRVTFKCGMYSDPESVAKSLCSWMLLQLGTLYEQRESHSTDQTYSIPTRFVDGMIDRYRMPSI